MALHGRLLHRIACMLQMLFSTAFSRLIPLSHYCSVEAMEAQLNQQEERSRDRAVALRALLRDDKLMDQFLSQHEDGQLELKVGRRGGWGGWVRWAGG